MGRFHLWEIHEQRWCPGAVRDGATDCLNMIARWGRQFEYVVPKLQDALRQTNSQRIIDLCSGSGGPWLQIIPRLHQRSGEPIEVWLTDLFPNVAAMQNAATLSQGRIHFVDMPVDATALGSELDGFRTLFTSFHHFRPQVARSILQDAVNCGQGIAIFEQTRRDPIALLLMCTLPFIALLVVPFIRPFRLSRLFWTYIVPAIPLVLCMDGLVSCLRTYSEEEMAGLVGEVEGKAYHWEIGRTSSPLSPVGVLYLIGYPTVEVGSRDVVVTSPRVEAIK